MISHFQIIVYRTEHNYIIPLAPITPPPRRARSRSQTSALTEDDRISHGAESYIFDEEPAANEEKFIVDIVKETNGYSYLMKNKTPKRRHRKNENDDACDQIV